MFKLSREPLTNLTLPQASLFFPGLGELLKA